MTFLKPHEYSHLVGRAEIDKLRTKVVGFVMKKMNRETKNQRQLSTKGNLKGSSLSHMYFGGLKNVTHSLCRYFFRFLVKVIQFLYIKL